MIFLKKYFYGDYGDKEVPGGGETNAQNQAPILLPPVWEATSTQDHLKPEASIHNTDT
jgi:hypothetical protein